MIPTEHLKDQRDEAEIIDWAMMGALDRLGFGTSGELAGFFDIVTREEAKAWCQTAMADGRIIEVDIAMTDGSLRRSFTTKAILEDVSSLSEPSSRVRLLSPFDPALRDRSRAERLFGFHYRIEIFVPEAQRRYGYYVFPLLQGDRLIGRLDVKRDGGTLNVRAFWPEVGVKMGKGRLASLTAELERVKRLANADTIDYSSDWLRI